MQMRIPSEQRPVRPSTDSPKTTYRVVRRALTLGELRRLREEPHEVVRELAEEGGDVVVLRLGPAQAFLLAHPDAIQHVLQANWRNYVRSTFQYRLLSAIAGQGLLTMDGPEWLERRRTAQPAFHRARIEGLLETVTAAAGRVKVDWTRAADGGEEVDVVHDMSRFALDVLGETLLGRAAGTAGVRDELVQATETVLEHLMARSRALGLIPLWAPTPGNRIYRAAMNVLEAVIQEAVQRARRGEDAGDLLRLLLA
jgi:cytochrome P450